MTTPLRGARLVAPSKAARLRQALQWDLTSRRHALCATPGRDGGDSKACAGARRRCLHDQSTR